MNRHLWLLTLVAAALPARAETPPLRLTPAEAVSRAREASDRLAALRGLERAAAAETAAARAGQRPELALTAGYTRTSEIDEFTLRLPRQEPRTIFPNIPDNYRSRAEISVPVYTGGRLARLLDSAMAVHEAAGNELDAARADVEIETLDAFWSLVTARESARVLADAQRAYDAHLEDAENRRRFGLVAANEVLAVEVERDRAELERLSAAARAEIAEADLRRLLGLPEDTPIEPLVPADEAAPAVDRLDAAAAAGERAEVRALRARLASAEALARAEAAAARPQLAAAAGFDYARPNREILPLHDEWDDTWDVSLNLTYRPFDGGRTAAAVARANARADALRAQLAGLERSLAQEFTASAIELRTARAALPVAERNREAATENLRVARERYREGVIPSSELLDAEVSLLAAGLDRTGALARLHLAAARARRAAGQPALP
ncbi:MAG: TolC family protein [Acidobacteria bacterium]|nr:TolC family protein [Acidobacteriota bacterium]